MAVSVMHRMDLCSEDTVCPRGCCTCTVGHRAGCSLAGYHRHGQRDFLHLVLPVGKAVTRHFGKTQHALFMGNRSRDKGCRKQRPSVVLGPDFIKQGNLWSVYTGVRAKVVPGPGQFPEDMV